MHIAEGSTMQVYKPRENAHLKYPCSCSVSGTMGNDLSGLRQPVDGQERVTSETWEGAVQNT